MAEPKPAPVPPPAARKQPREAMTAFDRLGMALLGLLVGVLTLLAYVLVVILAGYPRAAPALSALFLSPVGLAIVLGCGLVGAFAPEKLADLFALLWGNHDFWDTRRGRWTAAALAIALFAGLLLVADIRT